MNDIQKLLDQQNPQWSDNIFNTPQFKREIFSKHLLLDQKYETITVISGPRRTGKSVIIKQLINNLIITKTRPTQILYFESSPSTSVIELENLTNHFLSEISDSNSMIYLFLDEIQYVKDFEIFLKLFYDRYKGQIKITITGSTSIDYRNTFREQLLGRYLEYKLDFLSFQEYLELTKFKGLNNTDINSYLNSWIKHKFVSKSQILSTKLNSIFKDFLSSGRYPETALFENKDQINYYMKGVIENNIQTDAIKFFNVSRPDLFLNLYEYLIENTGTEISIRSLSKQSGAGDEKTFSNYIDYLSKMGLIKVVKNSIDPIKALNTNRKIYLNSQLTLLNQKSIDDSKLGLIVESYILDRLYDKTNIFPENKIHYYKRRKDEIDFINNETKEVIEVKYRNQVRFNNKLFEAVAISKKFSKTIITKNNEEGSSDINYIPAVLY